MIAEYAALATRIRQTLLDLDRVTTWAEMLFQQYQKMNDDGYTFNLRPTRLQELTTDLPGCYTTVKVALFQFITFLEDAAQIA